MATAVAVAVAVADDGAVVTVSLGTSVTGTVACSKAAFKAASYCDMAISALCTSVVAGGCCVAGAVAAAVVAAALVACWKAPFKAVSYCDMVASAFESTEKSCFVVDDDVDVFKRWFGTEDDVRAVAVLYDEDVTTAVAATARNQELKESFIVYIV